MTQTSGDHFEQQPVKSAVVETEVRLKGIYCSLIRARRIADRKELRLQTMQVALSEPDRQLEALLWSWSSFNLLPCRRSSRSLLDDLPDWQGGRGESGSQRKQRQRQKEDQPQSHCV